MMRALFVTPYYRPAHLGGIERAIEHLGMALALQEGMERPTILCSRYAFPPRYVAGMAEREILPNGLEVARISSRPRRPLPLFPYYSCPVTYFSPAEIGRVLREARPDVIHFVGDGWVWAHLAILALRDERTAVVFTPSFHDLTGSRAWLRWPNTYICRQAERTVTLTERERGGVAAAYRPPFRRVVTIPWGADFRAPARRLLCESFGGITLLCVGRLGEHKGQLWLLDVYARARALFTRPTRLIMVGADEGDAGGRAALQRRIAERGLGAEVTLTGEVDDDALERLYAEADLFVLFSRYEAFGLVYVEAMAHGVPVLTHDVGATAETLPCGAVVIPPYDDAAAVREMVRLVDDDAARGRLGAQARDLIAKTYSWETVAARYRRVYEEAIHERRHQTA